MSKYQKFYYILFIIITIINLSPIKSLAYFSAILFIIPFVFISRNSNLKLLIIIGIYTALYLFYSIIYDFLVTQSFIIGIFTYSSLLPIFIIDSKKIKSELLLSKIHKFILKVFVLESVLGIIQAIYGYTKTGSFDLGNGDFVEGTIHPQLESDSSFANPMYFCNMAGIIIFLIVIYYKYNSQNKLSWKYYIGIVAMILSSVVHSIMVLIVAFFISYFYISPNFHRQKSKLKSIITFVGIFTFITCSTFFILKDNLSGLWGMADEFNSGSNPRSRLINEFFFQIPNQYPIAPILGLGLGQFTSRANLISSGKYLARGKLDIPFIVPTTSSLSKKYVISKKIELMTEVNYYGSSQQPFFSYFSIFSEFGLIGFFLFLLYIIKVIFRLKKNSPNENLFSFGALVLVLYIFGLGIQENYFEVPQAILIPILLCKLLYANSFKKLSQ